MTLLSASVTKVNLTPPLLQKVSLAHVIMCHSTVQRSLRVANLADDSCFSLLPPQWRSHGLCSITVLLYYCVSPISRQALLICQCGCSRVDDSGQLVSLRQLRERPWHFYCSSHGDKLLFKVCLKV